VNLLDIVKTLLGITDTSKDTILTLYVDMTIQQILNYINRAELPNELTYVAAQMVVDAYNEMLDASKTTTGKATSVSEAGRSVSFDSSLATMAIERRIEDRQKQLNSFRLPFRRG